MSHIGAPADSWLGGEPPRPRGMGTGLVVVIACATFLAGCLSGYVVGVVQNFAGLFTGAMADPQVAMSIDVPTSVTVGETFTLEVRLTEVGQREQELIDLDFEGSMCDQFEIVSVDPAPVSMRSEYGYQERTFRRPIPPGGELVVAFTMRATAPGVHDGNVTAYTKSYASVSWPVSIRVDP